MLFQGFQRFLRGGIIGGGGNMGNAGTLAVFFSRSGENYMVGNIEKGNGEILAGMVQSMLGVPVYEIASEAGYPADYDECSKAAKAERDMNMRPVLRYPLPDMAGINAVVLVYPNWWGDLPMPVYTFLDSISTGGLRIYPVCTHEGNGIGLTDRCLAQEYPEASVMRGAAFRGTDVQEKREKTEALLRSYLKDSGFTF